MLYSNRNKSEISQTKNYPSYLSATSKNILQLLLQRDVKQRLGSGSGPKGDACEVKAHQWYQSVDWAAIRQKRVIPPFVPRLKSNTDVKYFDREFVELPAVNSEISESNFMGIGAHGQQAYEDTYVDRTIPGNEFTGFAYQAPVF